METPSSPERQLHTELCDQVYFDDCLRSEGMYDESVRALTFLTQTQLEVDERTAMGIVIDSGVLRPLSSRQATFEQAISAPILLLGDYVEGLHTAEEAAKWYDIITRDTLAITMKATHHDAGCIDRTVLVTKDLSCQPDSEANCPIKVVRHSLLNAADMRQFRDSGAGHAQDNKYLFDPEKAHAITLYKLQTAWFMNLISKEQAVYLRGIYDRRYESQLK